MAILTLHYWTNLTGGLAELRRVASRQVVPLFEPWVSWQCWLVEYFPDCLSLPSEQWAPTIEELEQYMNIQTVIPVPVPAECIDGFAGAYWCRQQAYLDPSVRPGSPAWLSYRPMLPSGASKGCERPWHPEGGTPTMVICANSRNSTWAIGC